MEYSNQCRGSIELWSVQVPWTWRYPEELISLRNHDSFSQLFFFNLHQKINLNERFSQFNAILFCLTVLRSELDDDLTAPVRSIDLPIASDAKCIWLATKPTIYVTQICLFLFVNTKRTTVIHKWKKKCRLMQFFEWNRCFVFTLDCRTFFFLFRVLNFDARSFFYHVKKRTHNV